MSGSIKLRVEEISLSFGRVNALAEVILQIGEEKISAVIGPNGAGKTCILNCINQFHRPQKCKINI